MTITDYNESKGHPRPIYQVSGFDILLQTTLKDNMLTTIVAHCWITVADKDDCRSSGFPFPPAKKILYSQRLYSSSVASAVRLVAIGLSRLIAPT